MNGRGYTYVSVNECRGKWSYSITPDGSIVTTGCGVFSSRERAVMSLMDEDLGPGAVRIDIQKTSPEVAGLERPG